MDMKMKAHLEFQKMVIKCHKMDLFFFCTNEFCADVDG